MDRDYLRAQSSSVARTIPRVLNRQLQHMIGEKAEEVLNARDLGMEETRAVLEEGRQRLKTVWNVGICMTVVMFALMVGMAIAAVTVGLVTGKSVWSIVFGGLSGASLLGVWLWKPFEKAFEAASIAQAIEIIIVGLEMEWAACQETGTREDVSDCIRAANHAALSELAKLKDPQEREGA